MTTIPLPDRPALVRRSQWLNYATMAYNSLWEGIEGLRGRSACGDDCHAAPGAA